MNFEEPYKKMFANFPPQSSTLCFRRDRELVLEGKLPPSEDFYKADKFHALHKRMQDIQQTTTAVRKRSSPAAAAAATSLKRKTSSSPTKTKVQWQYLVHKLHIAPEPATVVAGDALAADQTGGSQAEKMTNGTDLHNGDEDGGDDESRLKRSRVQHSNPIYQAFEDVEDVDDLYRLADTLINSAYSDKRF